MIIDDDSDMNDSDYSDVQFEYDDEGDLAAPFTCPDIQRGLQEIGPSPTVCSIPTRPRNYSTVYTYQFIQVVTIIMMIMVNKKTILRMTMSRRVVCDTCLTSSCPEC